MRVLAGHIIVQPLGGSLWHKSKDDSTPQIAVPEQSQSASASNPVKHKRTIPEYGRVVACGDSLMHEDGDREPCPVDVGAVVAFGRWDGKRINPKDEDSLCRLQWDELLAIMPDDFEPLARSLR